MSLKDYLGFEPFPWQQRLANIETLPNIVNIPTGCGKTSIIGIAALRNEYRRIVYVVDRRTIVSQTYEYAKTLEQFGWRVVQLRGGLGALDETWAHTPTQKCIIISTVDQVGSRLLYQGYGVGRKSRTIAAGLLGNDCLYILDEVHLSEPFRQTLYNAKDLGANIDILEMSATTGEGFGLNDEDRAHPVITQRINAVKKLMLHTNKNIHTALIPPDAQKILFVENVVSDAVELYGKLKKKYKGSKKTKTYDVHLVTGRMRPLEREAIDKLIQKKMASTPRNPFIVVATQCIEAGADYDFDLVVTRCASLDAVIQRAGRLNRRGAQGHTNLVLAAPKAKKSFVYGDKETETWDYLSGFEGSNFKDIPIKLELFAEKKNAPPLPSVYLDAWAIQSTYAPPVSAWLHGVENKRADLVFIWRDLEKPGFNEIPPYSREGLSVPFGSALRWLQGIAKGINVSDVEAESEFLEKLDEEKLEKKPAEKKTYLVWRDKKGWVSGDSAQPGDTILLDVSVGGLTAGVWNADSKEKVDCLLLKAADGRVKFYETEGKYRQIKRRVKLGSYNTGVEAPLEDHLQGVGAYAQQYAEELDLPGELFYIAGKLHDEGKRVFEFQKMLRDGSEYLIVANGLAAKSVQDVKYRYRHTRHEFVSAALIENENYPDLVKHLVASHHGHARPHIELKEDFVQLVGGKNVDLPNSLQWAVAERFWRLARELGHWRLSLFEAILRLADHQRSRDEAERC